jgi:outer membrane protein OmpA-like peptidoglycan-associated protein
MKRIVITAIIFGITSALSCGQENDTVQRRHEFSLSVGGGLSTLMYDIAPGAQHNRAGGLFGLDYRFFFNPRWGLATGFEFAFYNARYQLNDHNVEYQAIDLDGDPFLFRSAMRDYTERQNAAMLQIPLMLQFQTGARHKFYAAAGAKAAFPLNAKYGAAAKELFNTGFYAHENSLYDTQTFMGFGRFTDVKGSGTFALNAAFFAAAEAGIKWKLNNKWSLYSGVYFDYGLNNIVETRRATSLPPLIEYNTSNPPDITINSALKSSPTVPAAIKPLSAGVVLRLAFGVSPAPAPIVPPVPILPIVPKEEEKVVEEAARAAEEAVRKAEEEAEAARRAAIAAEEAARQRAAEEAARIAAAEATRQEKERAIAIAIIEQNMGEHQESVQDRNIGDYTVSQTDLNRTQEQQLDEKIALLQRYPDIRFHIYGHTCDLGSRTANDRIGLQRAEEVKAYMISKGIDESRILGTASKRDTEPLVPNDSEENRRRNRRVQILVEVGVM